MEANEAMEVLDGTGRAEADHGRNKEFSAELVVHSDDWSTADAIAAEVPHRGVPTTILTGFLGAGKTTVLNFLLRQEHGLRMAVLINEFGEVDIDSQIVQRGDLERDDTVLLKNGCICCTISNSFVESVQRVLSVDADRPPDYLVIETSGVADPAPILTNLEETELDDLLYIDQILTVVDSVNFHAQEMNTATARSQIHTADTILLSKTDLSSSEVVDSVVQELREMKPGIRIFLSRRGEVPIASLFDVGMKQRASRMHSNEIHPTSTETAHTHSHLDVDAFQSMSFVTTTPFDLKSFRSQFLKQLPSVRQINHSKPDFSSALNVFRAKGLLRFSAYPMRFIFQLSGRRFHIEQDDWPDPTQRKTQLVLIGQNIDQPHLRKLLEGCLDDQPPNQDYKILNSSQ